MASFFEIKFKDKTRFEKTLNKLRNIAKDWMDEPTANKLGNAAVSGMLTLIEAGASPIRGGRFRAYKNPKKYPGKLKPSDVVNLRLTGQFLGSLKWKVLNAKNGLKKCVIYFKDYKTKKGATPQIIESGHRYGANGQPKRPIMPQGKERLAVKIENKLSKILKDRLKQLLSGQ